MHDPLASAVISRSENFFRFTKQMSLIIRQRLWFGHDGAPPYFRLTVRNFQIGGFSEQYQYLSLSAHQIATRWTSFSGGI